MLRDLRDQILRREIKYNVLNQRVGHISKSDTLKLTKNWKNRTLRSQQPLNNKF